jgi:hypothetical protein
MFWYFARLSDATLSQLDREEWDVLMIRQVQRFDKW